MHIVRRRYEFSAAHRIEDHARCDRLHGHNYVVEVAVTLDYGQLETTGGSAERQRETGFLNERGFVIDFGEIDHAVKPLIERLDHRYLVPTGRAQDVYAQAAQAGGAAEDVVWLDIPSTSAENLAAWFCREVGAALPAGLCVDEITLWETPRNQAVYRPLADRSA
jgi:6-pyruvoyl tetrahydropterin synthase/QueD family protein